MLEAPYKQISNTLAQKAAPTGARYKYRSQLCSSKTTKMLNLLKAYRGSLVKKAGSIALDIVRKWRTKRGYPLAPNYALQLLSALNQAASIMSPIFYKDSNSKMATKMAKQSFRLWTELRATPLSTADARLILEDRTMPLQKWAMLAVCWATASRYADAKRMTDIDLTRFVINRRRIIRWRVKTLKSNKCGLTKWIPSGGNLTRLVNFLWPLARGVPSDTKETSRRAKATSVFSISRSTFVRAIQRTTKNNEYSAHSIRRSNNACIERHKNGSHTTPTWACRRTNNSDVRKPISSAARIASQHSSHTGASRTVNADTHICNRPMHDVPSPFDPGGSGDEFALIWDPSFGEGQWLNGCASFNHIIAPHSSVHAPLLCNEDDFPAEPLSIRGHFVSTSQSDNITWKITGGGIKLKTHTLAVDWPLDIISSNALDVDRIAANATQKEREIIDVIRNEASFLSVLTSHTDSFVRRSKLTGDDCALLESADTIESGDVETWCAAFKVAKKKKLSRLVIDATPLNRCCKRPPPMPLVSMDTFIRECIRAKFIATIDLRSFFYQIVVPSFMRKHFGICINKARGRGQRVRLKRLCMGWTWSPCIAQSIANIVARTARSRASFQDHVFLEPWLDNFVLCAQNETDFNVLKSSLIVVLREFSVEAHKFESGFEEPILGLMYRPDHTAQHPADFLSKAF